jgi:hypothetical protein
MTRALSAPLEAAAMLRVRASSATAPRLPDAGRQRHRRSGQTRDLPGSDTILLHVMWPSTPAVACSEDGIACFDHIRYRRHDGRVFLYAFDLIELDGEDMRRDPLAVRKATLASLLRRAAPGLRFNEHLDEEDGPLVFAHACKMGLEGIVSKRRDSHYRSGRSPDWIKSKNPSAPAVRREAEEDWGR